MGCDSYVAKTDWLAILRYWTDWDKSIGDHENDFPVACYYHRSRGYV